MKQETYLGDSACRLPARDQEVNELTIKPHIRGVFCLCLKHKLSFFFSRISIFLYEFFYFPPSLCGHLFKSGYTKKDGLKYHPDTKELYTGKTNKNIFNHFIVVLLRNK